MASTTATVNRDIQTSAPLPQSSEFRDRRMHMIGIGGSGMSGMAALLLRRGARVSGSDRQLSDLLLKLSEAGVHISPAQLAETLPADVECVVASAAVPPDNPELLAARQRGIPILKYAEMLGRLMAHSHGIAIAGTHGKSTTTAWLAYTLRRAGFDPSFVVGGVVNQLGGGSGVGDGPFFVAEACEYDRSFLNLKPRTAAILNIEEDHLDYYRDIADITSAFADFAAAVPPDGLIITNGQDAHCRAATCKAAARVETYGSNPGADWCAADVTLHDGRYSFGVVHNDTTLGHVTLGIPGRHNVGNALAVAALALDCGAQWHVVANALAEFRGVRRRLETRGEVDGIRIVDDYAHHPTEIRATLQAARERFQPTRLWCVFQPHQHSRTRFLLADFARSFALADEIIVPDIYFVRDSAQERTAVSSANLVDQIQALGGRARHVPQLDTIPGILATELRPGDLVVTMGAGNIWEAADALVRRLGGNLPA